MLRDVEAAGSNPVTPIFVWEAGILMNIRIPVFFILCFTAFSTKTFSFHGCSNTYAILFFSTPVSRSDRSTRLSWYQMRVDVHGRIKVSVAQPFLYLFRMPALGCQQGGRGMLLLVKNFFEYGTALYVVWLRLRLIIIIYPELFTAV